MSVFSNHWYGLVPAELPAYGGEQMPATTGMPYIILPVVPNPEPKIDAHLLDPTSLVQLAPEQQAAVPLPRPNPFKAFAKQPRRWHRHGNLQRPGSRFGGSTAATDPKQFRICR